MKELMLPCPESPPRIAFHGFITMRFDRPAHGRRRRHHGQISARPVIKSKRRLNTPSIDVASRGSPALAFSGDIALPPQQSEIIDVDVRRKVMDPIEAPTLPSASIHSEQIISLARRQQIFYVGNVTINLIQIAMQQSTITINS